MKNLLSLAALVALLVGYVSAASVGAQTSPEGLLESGVYKEEVEGDLEGAIEIFEKIIKDFSDNRAVAARALLHLGSSYEKLGNLKAEDAYRRLIEEYADQPAIVSEARIRLQEIRYRELTEGIQDKGAGPTYRIALDEDVPEVNPMRLRQYDFSPNGDLIAYQGNDGIYVSDATGTLRRQLAAQGEDRMDWFLIYPWVGQPRWSPDGKQIAYMAGRIKPPGDDADDLEYTIFLVDAEGGEPRQVVESLDPHQRGGLCWSPDGKRLTYLAPGGIRSLNLKGEVVGEIDFDTQLGNARLTGYSPDGRWLTIRLKADPESENNSNTNIYIVPADDGDMVQLTFEPGFDGHSVWSSDSRSVYFVSDRGTKTENSNLWKVRIESQTGQPIGDPEQVTFFSDARIVHPQVVGDRDKIAFLLGKKKTSIHVAPDGKPKEFITLARGTKPILSPDGETVYYVGEGPDNQGIFSISANGGRPKRLTSFIPLVSQKDLSPDGTALTYFSDVDDERGLFMHPLNGEDPILLTKTGCDECCISPKWSPDGKSIAYIYVDGIFVISSSGGEPKRLATLRGWEAWTIRWSPDGQYIAALGYQEGETNNAVFAVPAAGGEPRLISDFNDYKEGLEWHPDGQRLTYHLSKSVGETFITYLDGRPPEPFLNKSDAWDYVGLWSSDGDRYFLSSAKDNEWRLDVYHVSTGEFTPFGQNASLPHWSGDGKLMTWTTDKSIRQLWVMENFK
jgi:Tol biopolymer transport system component